jgi:peptide deformylase
VAIREIVVYPEGKAILREKSKPVRRMDRRVRKLVQDLKDTLNNHPAGIGLAAPQIAAHRRVVVVRLGGRAGREDEPAPPCP